MSDTPHTDALYEDQARAAPSHKAAFECMTDHARTLERERRWIPMTERAPDDGARVLVFDADKMFPWVGECLHSLIRGEHFFYGGGEGDCHYHVTHWMPLPAAP